MKNKKNTASIYKSVAIITLFAVLTRLLGFVLRIYLSRNVSSQMLGSYHASMSVLMILLTLTSSGIPLIISKMTVKNDVSGNALKSERMMTSSLFMSLIMSVVLMGLTFALLPLFNVIFKDRSISLMLLIMLPSVVFSAVYSVFRGNLWGKQDYFSVCVVEFVEEVVRIIICLLLFSFFPNADKGNMTALSLSIASFVSAVVVLLIYLFKGGKLKKPDKSYKELFKKSFPITLMRVVSSFSAPIITLLLPLRLVGVGYTHEQAMSLLGVAMGMTVPLLFVPMTLVGSLSMAVIPDIAKSMQKQDDSNLKSRIKSSVAFSLFVSIFLVPLYMGAGEEIGNFFFSNAESGKLLMKSAWLMIPMGLTNISSAILNGLGQEKKSFLSTIVGTCVMTALVVSLPSVFGIDAMFVSMGCSFLIMATLNFIFIKKKTHTKLNIAKPLMFMIVCIFPTSALTFFVCGILKNFFSLFFTLAVSCTIGFLTFVMLLAFFKVIDVSPFYVKIKKLKHHFKLKKNKN